MADGDLLDIVTGKVTVEKVINIYHITKVYLIKIGLPQD